MTSRRQVGEAGVSPITRSKEEYFSSLSSHETHAAHLSNGIKDKSAARMVLSGNSQNSKTSGTKSDLSKRLDIPLPAPERSRRHPFIISLFSILFVCAALLGAFFWMSYFGTARVIITPRQEIISVSGTFNAARGQNDAAKLTFETISIQEEVFSEIPADVERMADERATGVIVVYNAYSAAPQRLIKNTRFATEDGKIFRAKDSIVVPGTTIENGKIIPGSVEAIVVADEPGEAYNFRLPNSEADFIIPGFKGDPRYDKFYARLKPETEMAGGFSGIKKFPSESVIAEVRTDLRAELAQKLLKSAQVQKPVGYILFADAAKKVFADDPSITVDGGSATITERGVISGVIFKSDELSRFILKKSLATFEGEEVDIPDLENLTFVFAKDQSSESDEISFSLSGSAHVIWKVDTEGLARALADKPKKEFNSTLAGFSNIRRAEASISPFGFFRFPKDPSRINTKLIIE